MTPGVASRSLTFASSSSSASSSGSARRFSLINWYSVRPSFRGKC